MQPLTGFRDFLPASCAERNYIFAKWREVAGRYGFVEFDGPVLEELDLYKKKSGDEIVRQLYEFVDKGERAVALRPEMTPTLARIVAEQHRQFRKPLKWFSVPQVFRYERPQRGRLREHFQLNCDIIGEESPEADAELIALVITSCARSVLPRRILSCASATGSFGWNYLSSRKCRLISGKKCCKRSINRNASRARKRRSASGNWPNRSSRFSRKAAKARSSTT